MKTLFLIFLFGCSFVVPFISAQFGDSIGKGLNAGELLNQLLMRKSNEKKQQQLQQFPQTPAKIVTQEVAAVPEVQPPTTPAPPKPTSSFRPLGISSSLKFPPRLPFPRRNDKESHNACHGRNCEDKNANEGKERWTMPLITLGAKQYYLGIFFKANWYKASQFCRFHGMHLASIESDRENRVLEAHIQEAGLGLEHFWTSGTDQGEEGRFFWMANGRPVTYENWNAGEPNNFQYEDGEMEHCLELWNRDGKGLKWNDSPCSFETFFLCQV